MHICIDLAGNDPASCNISKMRLSFTRFVDLVHGRLSSGSVPSALVM